MISEAVRDDNIFVIVSRLSDTEWSKLILGYLKGAKDRKNECQTKFFNIF